MSITKTKRSRLHNQNNLTVSFKNLILVFGVHNILFLNSNFNIRVYSDLYLTYPNYTFNKNLITNRGLRTKLILYIIYIIISSSRSRNRGLEFNKNRFLWKSRNKVRTIIKLKRSIQSSNTKVRSIKTESFVNSIEDSNFCRNP